MAGNSSLLRFSEELTQLIPYIHRAMMTKLNDALVQGKITVPQYLVLELLNKDTRLKMNAIAHALKVSLPAATGLVNRLVRLKLVRRAYDQHDRRVVYVELTRKGQGTVEHIGRERKKMIEDLFSKLTEQERLAYLNIVRKLKGVLYSRTQ